MFRKFYIVLCLAACWWMMACTSSVRREAQETVVQVDSLWRAGEAYTDSAALAKAYETLSSSRYQLLSIFNKQLATDYAHACYHYGKLLRAKENPAAAMECFINATHSRTRDYHILGRVYNNIGDICHIAGEYALSYEMFERSANEFLKDGDTLSYYYCLNDMAFELAVHGKKDSALHLLTNIERNCQDEDVLSRHIETKAAAYEAVHQYDSAIYYAKGIVANGFSDPTAFVICAQAYSHIGCKDSAVLYAEKVCATSKKLSDLNNALYILTNDDDSRDNIAIRQTSADRADIQKLLEIRQGKLSQAVLLLQQDIHQKPNIKWLVAVCLTIGIIGLCLLAYVIKKRKQHQLLSQKNNDLEKATSLVQEKYNKLNDRYQTHCRQLEKQIIQKCTLLRNGHNLKTELSWTDYEQMSAIADKHFNLLASKLRSKHSLKEKEVRLCVLTLIGMSRADIADTLPYAVNSVGKLKDETAKKLGTTGKNLHDFLLKMAVEG